MRILMINEAMSVNKSEKNTLYVGLCGTYFVGSDRYAIVITEIISPKAVRVTFLKDNDYRNNLVTDEYGNDFIKDTSSYVQWNEDEMAEVPSGKIYKLRKNGRWVEIGRGLWDCGGIHFGNADNYRDPCF